MLDLPFWSAWNLVWTMASWMCHSSDFGSKKVFILATPGQCRITTLAFVLVKIQQKFVCLRKSNFRRTQTWCYYSFTFITARFGTVLFVCRYSEKKLQYIEMILVLTGNTPLQIIRWFIKLANLCSAVAQPSCKSEVSWRYQTNRCWVIFER